VTALLIGIAIKSFLLSGLTLGLLRLLRNKSSSQRSWIAHTGLGAILLLPLATLLIPTVEVDAGLLEAPPYVAAHSPLVEPAASVQPVSVSTEIGRPSARSIATQWAGRYWALAAYLVPALLLIGATFLALARLVALRARSRVITCPVWLNALAHALDRAKFKNGLALLVSDAVRAPVSWGLARPVILINEGALEATGAAKSIIAHELAHIASRDWAKLLLSRMVTALYWFNPFVWKLSGDAHQLREEAADDAVLAADVAAPDYAHLLVHAARRDARAPFAALGIAPRQSSLQRRVRRLLDPALDRSHMKTAWAATAAALFLAGSSVFAAVALVPHRAESAEPRQRMETGARPAGKSGRLRDADGAVWVAKVKLRAVVASDGPDRLKRAAYDQPRPVASDSATGDGIVDDVENPSSAIGSEATRSSAVEEGPARGAGSPSSYQRALARAGYTDIEPRTIAEARSVDLTPEYIARLAGAGLSHLSLDDLIRLRALKIDAEDVVEVRRKGLVISVNKLMHWAAVRDHPEN
jgi:bla regulator protein BlaR1